VGKCNCTVDIQRCELRAARAKAEKKDNALESATTMCLKLIGCAFTKEELGSCVWTANKNIDESERRVLCTRKMASINNLVKKYYKNWKVDCTHKNALKAISAKTCEARRVLAKSGVTL
jgi:hypothetical protein